VGTSQRIVIISDTHMGRPSAAVRSADMLRPLWQGAQELIVNGDVAEIHDAQHRGAAAREVLRLQQLCEADGVNLCLLSGNHDPLITDRRYLRLLNRTVFCVHGDILHPAISPWTPYAKRLAALHADALASLDPAQRGTLDGALQVAQHAAYRNWDHLVQEHWVRRNAVQRPLDKAVKLARVAWYWQTLPRRAIRFARQYAPESRFFVFGHIHRAGIWRDNHRVLINTGAFDFPATPRAAVVEAGQLTVHRIVRNDAGFTFAPRPLSSFSLACHAPPHEQAPAA
jgi:UDP-2,3-diacylglucosamine pyrophosphatase LpxH